MLYPQTMEDTPLNNVRFTAERVISIPKLKPPFVSSFGLSGDSPRNIMELRLQPKPVLDTEPASKGIVSREKFFVTKVLEQINECFFPAHFVRQWRPKAELLYVPPPDETSVHYQYDFNRDIQNCFVEDFAEEIYLRTPPPCFVIFGKLSPRVSKLSKNIAAEYGSVLIDAQQVANDIIRGKNDTGILLDKILRQGVPVTLNFILSLVSCLAHTAEARHRGYVLCGLPYPPLENDLSVADQVKYLFCWENKPTVFVYVSFEDDDLIRSRSCLRHEVKSVENDQKCLLIPHFQCDDKAGGKSQSNFTVNKDCCDDDYDDENEDDSEPEPDVNILPSRPWIRLPQNQEPHVWAELESFEKNVKPEIDLLLSRVDPQYVITVDSRIDNEFQVVKSRLILLKIWKSPIPFPFLPFTDVEDSTKSNKEANRGLEEDTDDLKTDEELLEIQKAAEESPEKAFLTLFSKKTLSPKFRWELSHYNYICPVSLRAGEVTNGKSEFAVGFMKYIYFLRSKEAMKLFLKNPRPFVLPVRPKPPSRFFIIGYPFCGKTTLARSLAREFSIPLINLDKVLKNDLEEKKNAYMEFCRQKAESLEIQRLTCQAWRDWRMEEEQRVSLIEDWIGYIQSLLEQRIEQFYSGKRKSRSREGSQGSMEQASEHSSDLVEGLQIRGIPVQQDLINQNIDTTTLPDSYSTPSAKIIQALKHEDYDFDKKGFEVEANLFFSTLWNSFSSKDVPDIGEKTQGENDSNMSIAGEDITESNTSFNWCNLLPPQSLSSLLLQREPHTLRKRRKSFRILLLAASKAYWDQSSLKVEFAKWRLPCFMDIPLCEIFVDNPLLLYKYCPEWIKQRPLIPDPVDPYHPAVVESGRKAYNQAKVVTLYHSVEEVGILLRNEIEKVERNGMRITGEVVSPGGWVVDNMTLHLEVWCMLIKENIRPSHVYILVDSEPEWRRIITTWFDIYNTLSMTKGRQPQVEESETMMDYSEEENRNSNDYQGSENEKTFKRVDGNTAPEPHGVRINIMDLVMESCLEIAKGELELNEIFENLTSESCDKSLMNVQQMAIDPFCYHILNNKFKEASDILEDSVLEESTLNTVNFSEMSNFLFSSRNSSQSTQDIGAQLEVFTNKVLNLLQDVHLVTEEVLEKENSYEDGTKFFYLLLTLSHKLETLKEWLSSINERTKVKEIDVYKNSASQVLSDVLKELYMPFGKKPRELQPFEVEEIKKAFQVDHLISDNSNRFDGNEQEETIQQETEQMLQNFQDPRIYGESGPFCIVNLERNILLGGNPKYALRYYGKLYFFWNEESKSTFLQDPTKYAPYYSPIRCLPPLRIFLLGPHGTQKASLATAISNQCGLHFVDYIKFISKQLIPHVDPIPNKLTALNASLLVSEAHNKWAKEALEEFKKAPHRKRQFWLENPPFYSDFSDSDDLLHDMLNLLDSQVHLKDVHFLYQTIDLQPDDSISTLDTLKRREKTREFISMDDITHLIENYIHKDSPLTEYCINKSLKLLWDKAPYATEGFILKDFPLQLFDSQIIIKNNWIPDVVIEISATEEEVIETNIDNLMELWDTKLNQQIVEEQLLEETVKTIQDSKKMVRRLQLLAEKRDADKMSLDSIRHSISRYTTSRRSQEIVDKLTSNKLNKNDRKSSLRNITLAGSQIQASSWKTFDAFYDTKVEAILEKEFPPLLFNPTFETYEEARRRIIDDMIYNYRKDVAEINKIKSELQSMSVPWWKMDSSSDTNDLFIYLDSAKKKFNQRGEFSFQVSLEMAEKLLDQGYYYLSKFGRFCPVQAYRQKNPVNMYVPLLSRKKLFPIVYRTYIYFVGGLNEKTKFMEDPIKYAFQEFHRPELPLRLSVIGPPKSGKSLLCKRLALMFGLRVITMGTAIRFALENMKGSELEKNINGYLRKGCFLPLSLKIKALAACLNDPACVTQGYVFDGIPFDPALTQSLAEKKNLPFLVLALTCDSHFGKINRQNLDLSAFRLPYKQRVNLDARYSDWKKTYDKFTHWNREMYHNLYEIDARTNSADVFYKAYDLMKIPYCDILQYMEFCVKNKALPLRHLCINPQEYEARRSPLEDNCPVCWTESHRLIRANTEDLYSGLVQYINCFYWVCSKHMNEFLNNCKRYLPPFGREWPSSLAKILDKSQFEALGPTVRVHGHGRCPVTCVDFPSSLSWEGSWDHMVYYENEVFLCKNEEMMERFLARPWRYRNANTTFEGSSSEKSNSLENLGPPKVTSLPPIGFLEQTVSQTIHETLQVLGSVRPVYPNLTPSCTACIFVALYLKVYNKKRKCLPLEKEYLDFMFYYCKAYRFRVPFRVPRNQDESQKDFEADQSDSDEPSTRDFDEETKSSQGTLPSKDGSSALQEDVTWVDFDTQADKKLWSAKFTSPEHEDMILLSGDQLQEIPDIPKRQVILRYSRVRGNPLPPVPDCLTFIYCRRPNLRLPNEFNVNTLYHPPPPFVSPYGQSLPCNPERQFSMSLYKHPEPKGTASHPVLTYEMRTLDAADQNYDYKVDRFTLLHSKLYVPRFHILDVVQPIHHAMPTVVEHPPIVYEPQRDYTYTMLLAHFFQNSHLLRCYEGLDLEAFIEYSNLIDKNLRLSTAHSQYFYKPKVALSVKSMRSIESYQRVFDARNTFFCRDSTPGKGSASEEEEEGDPGEEQEETSSLFNFMQLLISDKLDEIFSGASQMRLSYNSYETNILSSSSDPTLKPSIIIREVLPYPPLIWDITARPYYSQATIPNIYNTPLPENIAHERHVSLLDGIAEPYDIFRFVRYPTWVQPRLSQPGTYDQEKKRKASQQSHRGPCSQSVYYFFDFFHLEWTSFLCYPFSWTYDADISANFNFSADNNR